MAFFDARWILITYQKLIPFNSDDENFPMYFLCAMIQQEGYGVRHDRYWTILDASGKPKFVSYFIFLFFLFNHAQDKWHTPLDILTPSTI